MGVLQNLQKFRVRYGSVTKLTKVPGIVAWACRTHKSYENDTPAYPGCLWHWPTELPEVPGTGMTVVQNFHNFRVRGRMNVSQNLQKFFVG